MKKTIAAILALSALLTACGSKKDDTPGDTSIPETTMTATGADGTIIDPEHPELSGGTAVPGGTPEDAPGTPGTPGTPGGDTPVEQKHYSPEDFREIDVNVYVQQTEPPIKKLTFDLDFLAGMFDNPDNPYGRLDFHSITVNGRDLYYVILHGTSAETPFEIYRYGLDTGENELLYTSEKEMCVDALQYADGDLWLYVAGNEKDETVLNDYGMLFDVTREIYRVKDGKLESPFTAALAEKNRMYLPYPSNDKLMFTGASKNEDDPEKTDVSVWSADPETGKFTLEGVNKGVKYSYAGILWYDGALPVHDGKELITTVTEDHKVTASCQRYTLNSGLRTASLAAASENRVTFYRSDNVNSLIDTFDTERMEHYKLDISGLGNNMNVFSLGDWLLLSPNGRQVLCLEPSLGVAATVYSVPVGQEQNTYCFFGSNGDQHWLVQETADVVDGMYIMPTNVRLMVFEST